MESTYRRTEPGTPTCQTTIPGALDRPSNQILLRLISRIATQYGTSVRYIVSRAVRHARRNKGWPRAYGTGDMINIEDQWCT